LPKNKKAVFARGEDRWKTDNSSHSTGDLQIKYGYFSTASRIKKPALAMSAGFWLAPIAGIT
jgi:hypothetical protein